MISWTLTMGYRNSMKKELSSQPVVLEPQGTLCKNRRWGRCIVDVSLEVGSTTLQFDQL